MTKELFEILQALKTYGDYLEISAIDLRAQTMTLTISRSAVKSEHDLITLNESDLIVDTIISNLITNFKNEYKHYDVTIITLN